MENGEKPFYKKRGYRFTKNEAIDNAEGSNCTERGFVFKMNAVKKFIFNQHGLVKLVRGQPHSLQKYQPVTHLRNKGTSSAAASLDGKMTPNSSQSEPSVDAVDESDVFGTLSQSNFFEIEEMDEPEGDRKLRKFEEDFIPSDRKTLGQFLLDLRELLKEGKIKEALIVYEKQMPVDRRKPDKYIYTELMAGCARAGFSDKAFEIFKKMKDHGIKASPSSYTILFNACSNSPFKADALDKALFLRVKLQEEGVLLNRLNYHAMIKAFGRLGEVDIAFQLVDDMMKHNILPNAETFNFLLQAALSDRKEGFKLALVTWHKMLKIRIKPDLYSYNLLARIIRECSVGSQESLKEALLLISVRSGWKTLPLKSEIKALSAGKRKQDHKQVALISPVEVDKPPAPELVPLTSPSEVVEHLRYGKSPALSLNFEKPEPNILDPASRLSDFLSKRADVPNLVARFPNLKDVVDIEDVGKGQDRLALCGGLVGFLQDMHENAVKPDLKTFTELVQVIPNNFMEEQLLIEIMRISKVNIDVDFCNVLIKKRALSKRYKDVDATVDLMNELELHMNIVTFGTLALACRTRDRMHQLMKMMKLSGLRLNPVLATTLINSATISNDCDYLIEILKECKRQNVKPDARMLAKLESYRDKILRIFASRDKGMKVNEFFVSEDFQASFRKFSSYYIKWLKSIEVELPKHPWDKFKYTDEEVKAIVSE